MSFQRKLESRRRGEVEWILAYARMTIGGKAEGNKGVR